LKIDPTDRVQMLVRFQKSSGDFDNRRLPRGISVLTFVMVIRLDLNGGRSS